MNRLEKLNLIAASLIAGALQVAGGHTANAQSLSTTTTSPWANLTTDIMATTLPKQGDMPVSVNEYELTLDYQINPRHSVDFWTLVNHRLEPEAVVDSTTGRKTYKPTIESGDFTWFSHRYLITSPRLKNLAIKTKLTYAAPTTESAIESNHGGYFDARIDFSFFLMNKRVTLGLRPYYRKHLISNAIWTEGNPPTDFQMGNWFVANFKLTDGLTWVNRLNLRVNFPAKDQPSTDPLPEEENSTSTVTTSANFYSQLGYDINSNWNVFVHYRNESDFIDDQGYEINVAAARTAIFGVGAEVNF